MNQKINGHSDAYLKRVAKSIKKEQNIPYLEALEQAAKAHGFNNWKHFVNLSENGVPTVLGQANSSGTINLSISTNDTEKQEKTDPYRNLLVSAVNELVSRNLISLEYTTPDPNAEPDGYVLTELHGFSTAILWQHISYGEIRVSVWWKYEHVKHPQANLAGNARENFSGSSPLANSSQYRKFVGVVASAWLERKTGKYLQGTDRSSIFDIYTRRGEKDTLEKIPPQKPKGFMPEGKFFT